MPCPNPNEPGPSWLGCWALVCAWCWVFALALGLACWAGLGCGINRYLSTLNPHPINHRLRHVLRRWPPVGVMRKVTARSANKMTKDEEEELLELLRDAYDIIEALNNPEYRDWLDDARKLLDKVGR